MRNAVPITIVGNLTGDPELRFAATGTAVAKFTVAFNPRTLNKETGKWEDGEASFYSCTAFGSLAENVAESLTRGTRVVVSGEMRQRHWEADGEKKSMWQLLVDDVGPSLAYATARVQKTTRSSRDDLPPDDPWATGTREPAPAGAGDAGAPF